MKLLNCHLVDKQLNLHGLDKERFSISDEVIWIIIRDYTKEAGVRELRAINRGFNSGKAIKSILMDNLERKSILLRDNLAHWLGNAKYSYNKTEPVRKIGVVTGLAIYSIWR